MNAVILKLQELSKRHLVCIDFDEQALLGLWMLLTNYVISDFFMVTKAFLKDMSTRNKKKRKVPMGCRTDSLFEMIGKDYKGTNMHPNQYQHFFPAFTETGVPLMLLRALVCERTTA